MHYTLLLKKPANARYAQSLEKLALRECASILVSLGISSRPVIEQIAGVAFICFDSEALDEHAWSILSQHSAIAFAASMEDSMLRPIPMKRLEYLPEELPHVLKYKGKTNVDFTAMMLHCARAVSDFATVEEPLTVLDPVCGRGTTLFCALVEGYSAIGLDADRRAIEEAQTYFERFLQYHRLKHRSEELSFTLKSSGNAKMHRFTFADNADAYKRGDVRTLSLCPVDTTATEGLLRPNACHLIVGDLPYGVQHAPKDGKVYTAQRDFLCGMLKPLSGILCHGGAIALSFNTYTLPRAVLSEELTRAGFDVCSQPPYDDFEHWVEQAINRDLVLARRL